MDAEIPEDIRATARRVVSRGYDEGLVEAVERALLAERVRGRDLERERCAKIAEEYWTERPLDGRDIAAAIRS